MHLLKYIATAFTLSLPLLAATNSTWVPFKAEFSEATTITDSNGKVESQKQSSGEQTRTADGSLGTTETDNGVKTSGTVWDNSTGQTYRMDFHGKRAFLRPGTHIRKHNPPPGDPALGSEIVAGFSCTNYPLLSMKSKSPTGTICIDEADDIILKTQSAEIFNGKTTKYIWQLTKLSLGTTDKQNAQVPHDFNVFKGSKSK